MSKNLYHERQKLINYPFQIEVPTRFQDLDTLKHINNVAIAGLYEESRLQFHREAFREFRKAQTEKGRYRTVLADIHINYLQEAHYPYPITIGVGVGHIGRTSYALHCAMFQHTKCIGLSEAVIVFAQPGKPEPIPDGVRSVLETNRLKLITQGE